MRSSLQNRPEPAALPATPDDEIMTASGNPTGEGAWDVSFRFVFRKRPHTYSGSAQGSLSEGRLEGRVLNESKQRTLARPPQLQVPTRGSPQMLDGVGRGFPSESIPEPPSRD